MSCTHSTEQHYLKGSTEGVNLNFGGVKIHCNQFKNFFETIQFTHLNDRPFAEHFTK